MAIQKNLHLHLRYPRDLREIFNYMFPVKVFDARVWSLFSNGFPYSNVQNIPFGNKSICQFAIYCFKSMEAYTILYVVMYNPLK